MIFLSFRFTTPLLITQGVQTRLYIVVYGLPGSVLSKRANWSQVWIQFRQKYETKIRSSRMTTTVICAYVFFVTCFEYLM
jgi:hypothetical protein